MVERKLLQTCERSQMLQSLVASISAVQVERLQSREFTEVFQSVIAYIRRTQRQVFDSRNLGAWSERFGADRRSREVQLDERRQPFQIYQPGAARQCSRQSQLLKFPKTRQMSQPVVGHGRVAEVQRLQTCQPFDRSQSQISNLRRFKVERFKLSQRR